MNCVVSHNLLKSGFLDTSRRPSGGRELFLFSKCVVLDSRFLQWLALAPFLFYIAKLQLTGGLPCAGETRDFNSNQVHLGVKNYAFRTTVFLQTLVTKSGCNLCTEMLSRPLDYQKS